VLLRPGTLARSIGWLPLTTLVLSVLGLVDSSLFSLIVFQASAPSAKDQRV
jgi:hypothetical protein